MRQLDYQSVLHVCAGVGNDNATPTTIVYIYIYTIYTLIVYVGAMTLCHGHSEFDHSLSFAEVGRPFNRKANKRNDAPN